MKVLLTGAWRDDGKEWLELTQSRMEDYANRHGYVFKLGDPPSSMTRHPSWYKLDCIEKELKEGNEVLWVDADIVIMDPTTDVWDTVKESKQTAFVIHASDFFGHTPCIGWWVVKDIEVIQRIRNLQYKPKLPGLRELEPFALTLGASQEYPMRLPILPPWCQELPYVWNQKIKPYDIRGTTPEIKCFHCTGVGDREERMTLLREWVAK